MKKFDVFGVGNALVDCVCLVSDSFLDDNNIEKGLMTIVDDKKQKSIIEKIKDTDPLYSLVDQYLILFILCLILVDLVIYLFSFLMIHMAIYI